METSQLPHCSWGFLFKKKKKATSELFAALHEVLLGGKWSEVVGGQEVVLGENGTRSVAGAAVLTSFGVLRHEVLFLRDVLACEVLELQH